jgi:hypothetical protein
MNACSYQCCIITGVAGSVSIETSVSTKGGRGKKKSKDDDDDETVEGVSSTSSTYHYIIMHAH